MVLIRKNCDSNCAGRLGDSASSAAVLGVASNTPLLGGLQKCMGRVYLPCMTWSKSSPGSYLFHPENINKKGGAGLHGEVEPGGGGVEGDTQITAAQQPRIVARLQPQRPKRYLHTP